MTARNIVVSVVTVGGEPLPAADIWRIVQWGMSAGLPLPKGVEVIENTHTDYKPWVNIKTRTADEARTWADWLRIETAPDTYDTHVIFSEYHRDDGWTWHVRGSGKLTPLPELVGPAGSAHGAPDWRES